MFTQELFEAIIAERSLDVETDMRSRQAISALRAESSTRNRNWFQVVRTQLSISQRPVRHFGEAS